MAMTISTATATMATVREELRSRRRLVDRPWLTWSLSARPILVGDDCLHMPCPAPARSRAPPGSHARRVGRPRRPLDLRLRVADLAARVRGRRGPRRPRCTAGTARWRCARASTAARRSARAWSSRSSRAARAAGAPTGSSSSASRPELRRLWGREMPTGVYDPKWLACRTPHGIVRALAFTLSRRSPSHTGALPDGELLEILRTRERPLRQHPRLPRRDRSARCAPAASATAMSSAWSRWRAATR